MHCFCLGARSTPHRIVRQASNGRLLHEARDWITLAELRRKGIEADPSQVRELLEFNLIERDGDALRCAFAAIGPETLLPLRARMQDFAGEVLAGAGRRIDDIAAALDAAGLRHSFHAILFGHVMDGRLWTHLRPRIDLPETAPNRDFPHWRGVFWVVYPPRPGAIGTNEIVRGAARLTMVWSQQTTAMLDTFRNAGWSGDLLAFLAGEAERPPPEAVAAGLTSPSGSAGIPVIGSGRLRELEQAAEAAAATIAQLVLDRRGLFDFLPGMPTADSNVILLHEFIWAAQAARDPAVKANLNDLLFVTISS